MAEEAEGWRCPQCGEQHPLGCTVCNGCGGALVPDEPAGQGGRASGDDAEAADGEAVAYDLVDWTASQRGALELLLTGWEIPHEWSRAHVVVPAARADQVEDLLEGLGPEPQPAGPVQDEPAAEEVVRRTEHVIAGPGRRLLGSLVDGAVWTVVGLGLSFTGLSGDDAGFAHDVTMAGVIAAYEIVSVALWGRTIGKLVAGTRVVALASGAPPGWSRAALRWAVPSVVGLLSLFQGDGLVAGVAFMFSGVVTIVVYVGVLHKPLRQGVHDRAAGTVVVLVSTAGEYAVDRSIIEEQGADGSHSRPGGTAHLKP